MFAAPLIEEIGSQFLYTELHQFMASFYWFSCPKQDSRISIFCPITFYFIPSQNCKEVPFIVFCTLLAWRSYYVQWSHFSFNLDKHGGSEQYIHSEIVCWHWKNSEQHSFAEREITTQSQFHKRAVDSSRVVHGLTQGCREETESLAIKNSVSRTIFFEIQHFI